MTEATLTVTFEGEAAARLAELAEASGRSPQWFADFMIREYAAEEMRIVGELAKGAAEARDGLTVSNEEALARLDETIERATHRDAAE